MKAPAAGFGVASSLLAGDIRSLAASPSATTEEEALPAYVALLDGFSSFVREMGFDLVEVEFGFSVVGADRLMSRAADFKRLLAPFRTVMAHLPIGEVNISALYAAMREAAIAETKRYIDFCRELGISKLVAHPGSFAGMADRYAILQKETRGIAYASVSEVNRYCVERGMELAVENLHCMEPLFNTPEEMEPFAQDGIGIALDTAHAAVSGVSAVEFVRKLGRHITEVHLSDSASDDPVKHVALGCGDADLCGVLDELDSIGFSGRIVIEVESRDDLLASIDYLKANGYQPTPT